MNIMHRALGGLKRRIVAPLELSARGGPTPTDIFGPAEMAVYVHLPFCDSLCPYCVFNKNRDPAKMSAYAYAVAREIAFYGRIPQVRSTPVHAVYLGGGTPSLLPANLIEQVLTALRRHLDLRSDVQISLEANPDSLESHKLDRYRAAGVNRISVGAQSFNRRSLQRLGRHYGPEEIHAALDRVKRAGFSDVSLDLMFGLPEQTLADFASELDQAISTPVVHLSLFAILYQPETPLWRRRVLRRPLWTMYEHAVNELGRHGFTQYTAEDFTRTGDRCGYQVEVWKTGTKGFLGFGAGALSVYGNTGWYNIGDLTDYIEAAQLEHPPIAGGGSNGTRRQMLEHLMAAAKTLTIDPATFEERFTVPLRSVVGPLPELLRWAGMLHRGTDGTYGVTTRGAFYASLAWGDLVLRQLAQAGASRGPSRPSHHRERAQPPEVLPLLA